MAQHFGQIPSLPKSADGPRRKTLWLYALSLGEVVSAEPMLKRIHDERPDIRIVVSVTTDSGYDGAKEHLAFVDQIIFHPLDCLPFNLSAMDAIQPGCVCRHRYRILARPAGPDGETKNSDAPFQWPHIQSLG